jgi:hypothetical protein
MVGPPLVGHAVVQMGAPSQARLLAALGMLESLHHASRPVDGVVGWIQRGAGHGHLRVCQQRRPTRLRLLAPAPDPRAIGYPCRLRHMVRTVA